MRVAVLSAALIVAFVANASAADRITHAFGGRAYRNLDTIGFADRFPRRDRESTCEQLISEPQQVEKVGIGSLERFLREPNSHESLFKSGELFLFNSPPSVNEGSAGAEPERIRGAFHGMLLAI